MLEEIEIHNDEYYYTIIRKNIKRFRRQKNSLNKT